MPTLIRSERQTLRAIQEHMLLRKRRAGAAYTQISTVGVVFHSDNSDPAMNLVTPHQGVAWTRADDLRQGFSLLEGRDRIPRLQFLRGLFPEAFGRQLALHGLHLESRVPIWVYVPIQGPFPDGERPFGRILAQEHAVQGFHIDEVNTFQAQATWQRVFRSATFDVEITDVPTEEVDDLQNERRHGDSIFLLGYYHKTPIAALQISINGIAAEIIEPAVIHAWTGMGFEEALFAFAIKMLLHRNYQTIYTVGNFLYDQNLYWRLGFIQVTEALTYVR
ncbi:MAG: GNAT family N-acetyltransferase [Chloroflexi bacterium]|nr:GNAT family N-acetyltransferase [Chloroflexota bacterium]